jgi:hypothetical protein
VDLERERLSLSDLRLSLLLERERLLCFLFFEELSSLVGLRSEDRWRFSCFLLLCALLLLLLLLLRLLLLSLLLRPIVRRVSNECNSEKPLTTCIVRSCEPTGIMLQRMLALMATLVLTCNVARAFVAQASRAAYKSAQHSTLHPRSYTGLRHCC